MSFIHRYEEMLKEKHIPKMHFYKECGISDAAISQWRKGKTVPSMKSINQIAEYLGTSPEYLQYGLEQEKKPTPVSESGPSIEFANLMSQLTPEEQKLIVSQIKGILSNRE